MGRSGLAGRGLRRIRGTRAAGLGHAVPGLVDALRQGGELLLRGSEFGACFGPSLDRSAVFEPRGTDLCSARFQFAGRFLQLLLVAENHVAPRGKAADLLEQAARRPGRIGKAAPADDSRKTKAATDEERPFGPAEQMKHGRLGYCEER